MRATALIFAFLACTAIGRRVQTTAEQRQGGSSDESNPADSLGKLLQAFNTPVGGNRMPAKEVQKREPAPAMQEAAPEVKMSRAIPFIKAPPFLDGSMPGDQGFDPLGFSTTFNTYGTGIKYQREAELMHGRQAMLACVGMIWPEYFGKLNVDWAQDVSFNPLIAQYQLPPEVYAQLFAFMAIAEGQRFRIIFMEDREPGDHGFDPLDFIGKFCKTPEELQIMKEKEIANGRLAMIAWVGMLFSIMEKGELPPFF